MKTKIKNEKSNSFAIIIGIFFLLSSAVFCGFVVFDNKNNLNSTSGVGEFSSIQKLTELDDVNEHLKSVTDKLEVERLKALVANLKASNEIGLPAKTTTSLNSDQPIVDFSDDPRIYQQAQELGRINELNDNPKDPRSVVYDSVIEDRKNQKLKELDRKQQAKAFVANARKDGWIVTLDKNYKIRSYRRVEDVEGSRTDEADYRGYEVIPK